MNFPTDRWHEIDALFDAALDRPPDQRDAFLQEHCGDDTELYQSVKELLDASDNPDPALERSFRHRVTALWAAFTEFIDSQDETSSNSQTD